MISQGALGHAASDMSVKGDSWWDQNPEAGVVCSVPLDDTSKIQLELLFAVLDRKGSGTLTTDDFFLSETLSDRASAGSSGRRKTSLETARDALLQREVLHKWDELLANCARPAPPAPRPPPAPA